jgi:rubrerythrin
MKRRLFLKSLWIKSIALPSAYLLSPSLLSKADSLTPPESDADEHRHGCGRTDAGEEKRRYGFMARDFFDPHLELIRLLKEASEIEHSLMIQYLFAAFSLKPKYQALVGPPVPSSDGLLGIAIQEMQHLAIVNRLLVALGAGPNLDRQDFPHEPDIYPFPLNLERLTRASLARYTYVEAGRESMPTDGPMAATNQRLCDALTAELGADTQLNHVAGLYAIIIRQLETMAEEGSLQLDDLDDWLEQLNYIALEGEQQHFEFFSRLLLGLHPVLAGQPNPWNLDEDDPDYPSFSVAPNPTAYLGHENQITEGVARALAWISNLHYWVVLMMLDLYYRTGREGLNAMAQAHMVGPMQSLAGRLAKDHVGLPFDRLSMGYSPAPDHAGNLRFIGRLSAEIDSLVNLG